MKIILSSVFAYLFVCWVAIFLPANDGYDTLTWKLVVAQVYAIPIAIIVASILIYIKKKPSQY